MKLGIVGAGKLGIVLAQLARKAGYEVALSGSGDPAKIRLSVSVLAPGSQAFSTDKLARWADVIILALPLSQFRSLSSPNFADKLIIDATNYWDEVDGPRSDTVANEQSTSEAVQAHFDGATVVKALSHMGYHELHDFGILHAPHQSHKAMALAGDNKQALAMVSTIITDFGFLPIVIGPLAAGRLLEPGNPGFGLVTSGATLLKTLRPHAS